MLLEFTLSSQARMPNWLLLRQLYSGGDSGAALSGNVVVQALPTVQRSFGAWMQQLTLLHTLVMLCLYLSLVFGIAVWLPNHRLVASHIPLSTVCIGTLLK